MHPFALSRADDAAKAIAAHAMDPQLAFIAGGTDLLGLIKDRAAHPERLLETRDQAAHAGTLIDVEYAVEPPVVFSPPMARDAVVPPQRMWPLASSSGDARKAIADAPVKIEAAYTMPDRHYNAMEPHATLAVG